MGQVAELILATAKMSRRYGENLLKDVPASRFARLATQDGKPVQSNHPAFVYGHLSIYPKRITTVLGATVIENPPKFEELFLNGKPCLDDPAGTIYPPMDSIVSHYNAGYDAAAAAIAKTSDADFAKLPPDEGRTRELFPTQGALVGFLMSGHQMSHFGQVSAWRRLMGLGSAF
ncbi:MAG: DinB family protein [Phycisphaerales bacterium]